MVAVDLNPQKRLMADESMVRTLAAQTEAIWPQECELISGYGLPAHAEILDAGCGTGEFTSRLAAMLTGAQVLGIEILPEHVAYAQQRHASLVPRLTFREGDAFALDLPDDRFDFVACRHMLQSIPHPDRVIAELIRVTRPGGRLYFLAEDYGMIHAWPTRFDLDDFWRRAIRGFTESMQVDPRIGRRTWYELYSRGIRDPIVNYLTVDSLRVPREILVSIFEHWRDGYAATVGELTGLGLEVSRAHFDDIIDCARNPLGYVVWQVPIVTGLKP
ncbi:MAG: class I SAM-dependent methyltransferase [Gammaproteobacteria bacterium]